MSKIICVLYDDPVTGHPKSYPRDSIPVLKNYPNGQTLPNTSGTSLSAQARYAASGSEEAVKFKEKK